MLHGRGRENYQKRVRPIHERHKDGIVLQQATQVSIGGAVSRRHHCLLKDKTDNRLQFRNGTHLWTKKGYSREMKKNNNVELKWKELSAKGEKNLKKCQKKS